MAGKRPDQYQIAPGEATRTDYKWTADADPVDLQNQKASRSRARARGRQLIPPEVSEPAVEGKGSNRKARRTRRKHGGGRGDAGGQRHASGAERQRRDDRV